MNNSEDLVKLIKYFISNKDHLLQLLKEKGIKLGRNLAYDEIISRVGEKEVLNLFQLESVPLVIG